MKKFLRSLRYETFSFPGYMSLITSHSVDICMQLCNVFTADSRGNGFDLCESPEGSTCNSSSECTNLFWSRTDDGASGIVYETNRDLIEMDRLEPLTCEDAGQIVRAPTGPLPDPSTRLLVALQIFSSMPCTIRDQGNHELSQLVRAYGHASEIVFDTNSPVTGIFQSFVSSIEEHSLDDVYAVIRWLGRSWLPPIPPVMTGFDTRSIECTMCGNPECYPSYNAADTHTVIPLQQIIDETHQAHFDHPGVCGTSGLGNRGPTFSGYRAGVIGITVTRGANISYPLILRFENDPSTYDLIGLAHLDSLTGQTFADVYRNSSWYRTSGRTMTLRPLSDNTNFTTVTSAYYFRRVD